MDIDPKTSVLCSQKEVDAYLVKCDVRLSSNVQVECPANTDFTVAPCRRHISSSSDLGVGVEALFNKLHP